MKRFLVVIALGLAGCCGWSEATIKVVDANAEGWSRVATFAALVNAEQEIDGATVQTWQGRIRALRANALILQAAANGTKLPYAEAYERAADVEMP